MLDLQVPDTRPSAIDALRRWAGRQFAVAALAALVVAAFIGVPTDVIPNPVFGRPVPVTWWSYPTLVVTALLGGLLVGTYVRRDEPGIDEPLTGEPGIDVVDVPSRNGGIAGLLSFFAVGCPVCNKVVIVALGATGARQWFEPIQPVLAVASIVLLAWALRARLRSADTCRVR
jgi:hypothetical protein